MVERLVFLWDSRVRPSSVDVQMVRDYLGRLAKKGVKCEMADTRGMEEKELRSWRETAQTVAMLRKQGMRQHFASKRAGGFRYLGKEVPALFVYAKDASVPLAVYPHTKSSGREAIDHSIEAFLQELDCSHEP